jgi:hypothetical protein
MAFQPAGGLALKIASAINDRQAFSTQMKSANFSGMGITR